jgi:protein phosphatase PTC1
VLLRFAFHPYFSVNSFARKDSVTSEPFYHEVSLTPDDQWLIVACDGLWDVVSDVEAVLHIQGCESAADACERPFSLPNCIV